MQGKLFVEVLDPPMNRSGPSRPWYRYRAIVFGPRQKRVIDFGLLGDGVDPWAMPRRERLQNKILCMNAITDDFGIMDLDAFITWGDTRNLEKNIKSLLARKGWSGGLIARQVNG